MEKYLSVGKNVVYMTLGDPAVYSTFCYLQKIISDNGYETHYISGVTSFCAAAAQLGIPLVKRDEILHIVPTIYYKENILNADGNYVFMKSGKNVKEIKSLLSKSAYEVFAVEKCGMEQQRIYKNIDDIPDEVDYLSLIIALKSKDYSG